MPGQDLLLNLANAAVDVLNLSEDQADAPPRQLRQGSASRLLGQLHKLGHAGKPLRSDDAGLGQVTA
jgi:hypothetical protein